MINGYEGALDADELRARLAKVLKCLIRMRAISDPEAMQSGTICQQIRVSAPTLKKLLAGDAGKVEHLFALVRYLGVKNCEVFQIAETYTTKEDLAYQVSVLVQSRFMARPEPRIVHVQHQSA